MREDKNRNIPIIPRRFVHEDETGSITPLSVALIIALFVLGGLFIDLAVSNTLSQKESNQLACARDTLMSTPVALQVKNAENPGRFVAEEIMISLRTNGYNGNIWVFYIEAPQSGSTYSLSDSSLTVPANRRALAWGVQTETDQPTLLLRFSGIDEMPVWSTIAGSSMPYSSNSTWRPLGGDVSKTNGVYTLRAGEDITKMTRSTANIKFTALSSTEMPEEVMDALKEKVAEAQQYETEGQYDW